MKGIFLALVFCMLSFASEAQTAYTPEKGSTERKMILDALRIPTERDLKQKIVFVTDSFKVQGSWAFVSGTPQTTKGGTPNYRGTKFSGAVESGAFDNNFFALLKKSAGRWKVVTYAIGCTDVCYSNWWGRYRAPKSIFPYTE